MGGANLPWPAVDCWRFWHTGWGRGPAHRLGQPGHHLGGRDHWGGRTTAHAGFMGAGAGREGGRPQLRRPEPVPDGRGRALSHCANCRRWGWRGGHPRPARREGRPRGAGTARPGRAAGPAWGRWKGRQGWGRWSTRPTGRTWASRRTRPSG
ncbi:MAG: hypothetical protein [Caudoviricetes sp.]|nr:MAG: hypothetical protein [Caudoviricetes sp.]